MKAEERIKLAEELLKNQYDIRECILKDAEQVYESIFQLAKDCSDNLIVAIVNKKHSRTTRREVDEYTRYLEQLHQLARNIERFYMNLRIKQAADKE